MRNFKQLEIWKKGIHIVKELYKVSNVLPKEEKFGLRSQMTRVAVSVPSNIAEGCSRNSEIEFKRFLEISLGSLFEVETQLIIATELGFLKQNKTESVLTLIEQQSKMINKLINKIRNNKG